MHTVYMLIWTCIVLKVTEEMIEKSQEERGLAMSAVSDGI